MQYSHVLIEDVSHVNTWECRQESSGRFQVRGGPKYWILAIGVNFMCGDIHLVNEKGAKKKKF